MRVLYLPYEIRSREFISYQYLGNEAVKAGVVDKVVIGDRETLQKLAVLGFLMPGIWYLKSAQYYVANKLKRLKKLKFKIIVHDAESVCDFELDGMHDCFMKPPISLSHINTILTSLESETKAVKSLNPDLRVVKSGFLRFLHLEKKELLNSIYKDDANSMKSKYGNYIFIILSGTAYRFASFDSYLDHKKQLLKEGVQDWHSDLISHWINISHLSFFSLLDFIRLIISDKKYKVIIRPHPSEDKLFLSKLFRGFDDVFIDDSCSLHGAILGSSKVVLSPVSTTSFECAILEKESYCLLPELSKFDNKIIASHFVNSLSTPVKSAHDLYFKIMRNEKSPNSVIIERKKNALKFVGLNEKSISKWLDALDILSRSFKSKNKSRRMNFKLQNILLLTISYFYKYLGYLLIKDIKYVNYKLKGNEQIPLKVLHKKFPNNFQHKVGNFNLITRKDSH